MGHCNASTQGTEEVESQFHGITKPRDQLKGNNNSQEGSHSRYSDGDKWTDGRNTKEISTKQTDVDGWWWVDEGVGMINNNLGF